MLPEFKPNINKIEIIQDYYKNWGLSLYYNDKFIHTEKKLLFDLDIEKNHFNKSINNLNKTFEDYLLNKYFDKFDYPLINITKKELEYYISFYEKINFIVCCEFIPFVQDNFESILNKIITLIEVTNKQSSKYKCFKHFWVIIIDKFIGSCNTRQKIKQLCYQNNINVIFNENFVKKKLLNQKVYDYEQLIIQLKNKINFLEQQ